MNVHDRPPTGPAAPATVVDAGGLALAVRDVGRGEPVVFVHGVLLSGALWTPTIAALPPTRRYITFDLPGHGASPVAADVAPSVSRFAVALADLLDALGVERAHLVANDSGGAIAQRFAAAHPHRVATMALTNCDTEGNIPPPAFEPAVELARAGTFGDVLQRMHDDLRLARSVRGLGSSLQQPDSVPDDTIRGFFAPLLTTPEATASVQRFLASFHPDDLAGVTATLAASRIPTLLAWGTDDVFFGPSWGRRLAEELGPSATLVEVPGARLFWPLERPAELAVLLQSHWSAHPIR